MTNKGLPSFSIIFVDFAGECTTMLKKLVPESAEWARLEDFREVKVKDYIDDLTSGKADDLYLFDWSLPLHCPQLATEVTVPKYFAGTEVHIVP